MRLYLYFNNYSATSDFNNLLVEGPCGKTLLRPHGIQKQKITKKINFTLKYPSSCRGKYLTITVHWRKRMMMMKEQNILHETEECVGKDEKTGKRGETVTDRD